MENNEGLHEYRCSEYRLGFHQPARSKGRERGKEKEEDRVIGILKEEMKQILQIALSRKSKGDETDEGRGAWLVRE